MVIRTFGFRAGLAVSGQGGRESGGRTEHGELLVRTRFGEMVGLGVWGLRFAHVQWTRMSLSDTPSG